MDLAEVALGDGTTSVLLRRPGTPPAAHSALGLTFLATKAKVSDKKPTPDSFLQQLVEWGKNAPEGIFADNATSNDDVYPNFVKELGPYGDIVHRRACMLEVMRVLAGFESSWNWGEGIDQSKPEKLKKNSRATEAGAWQVSLDAVGNGNDLKTLLVGRGLDPTDAGAFQNAMKTDHPLAMEFIARLLRHTCHHNGPLFSHLVNGQLNETVHKWLNRDAVKEFQRLLTT